MRYWSALLAAAALPVMLAALAHTAVAQDSRSEEEEGDFEAEERPRLRPPAKVVPSPITDRFYVRGSYFKPDVDTDLRVDSGTTGVAGTPVSAEDDFGLDDSVDQGRMEMMFRLRERNRLRVDYFKLDRFAARTVTRPINFGDTTFDANQGAATSFDWRMLGFTWSYSALRRERYEVGVGLGIHLLEAEAIGQVIDTGERDEASGAGAFPTFAIDGTWRITPQFALTGRAQHFSVSVDGNSGSLADYHMDVQYRWRPNFALGFGYTIIRARLELDDDDFPGRFGLKTNGPEAFLRISF